jgi:hypothetical protein
MGKMKSYVCISKSVSRLVLEKWLPLYLDKKCGFLLSSSKLRMVSCLSFLGTARFCSTKLQYKFRAYHEVLVTVYILGH